MVTLIKSPLRGSEVGVIHYYWFLDGVQKELAKENILIDDDCCLPMEVFRNLSIEALISDKCCVYTSAEAALKDLERAYKRLENG